MPSYATGSRPGSVNKEIKTGRGDRKVTVGIRQYVSRSVTALIGHSTKPFSKCTYVSFFFDRHSALDDFARERRAEHRLLCITGFIDPIADPVKRMSVGITVGRTS